MPIVADQPDVRPTSVTDTLRILIVDDQVVARAAVRSALEKLSRPFVVIEADNGEEALSIMRNTRIDVIFCDIQLPGISGPEALAHAYGGQFPKPFLVLMSTQRTAKIAEIGHRIGIYEFLPKPFKAADVLNAMKAYEQLQRVVRVLLVDDSSTARKLMMRILAKSQFLLDVTQAENGLAAIKLARQQHFDVIFLDYNMPGINGVEAAGILMQEHPHMQVVVISTEQQSSTIRSAQFVGAFAFLKKPFESSDVDALLHEAFAIKPPSIAKPSHAIISNPQETGRQRAAPAVR